MKRILFIAIIIISSFNALAQVGIGTTNPNSSAALDVVSTTKGFLPPRMTKVQMEAITTPAEGLMLYCSDCSPKGIYYFDGFNFVNSTNALTSGTEIVNVVSPTTGRIWMDRNLGASQAATSTTDAASYGYHYQWGRKAAFPFSYNATNNIAGPVASGVEETKFVTNSSSPNDWLTPQDDSRWNSGTEGTPVKTANDPCPNGYRIPTSTELNAELATFATTDAAGAFGSFLKFPTPGHRRGISGLLSDVVGVEGYYWSSTVNGSNSVVLLIGNNYAKIVSADMYRVAGFSVRCIKEQ